MERVNFSVLDTLKSLTVLDVTRTQVDDNYVVELGNLQSLKSLNLSWGKNDVSALTELAKMTDIHLRLTKQLAVVELEKLNNLEGLDLSLLGNPLSYDLGLCLRWET